MPSIRVHRRRAGMSIVVGLAVLAAGCGDPATVTPTSPTAPAVPAAGSQAVMVDFIVDPGFLAGTDGIDASFEASFGDGAPPQTLHTHPLDRDRERFTINLENALGVDIVVDGSVVVSVHRTFWEAMARGPMVIRVSRGGAMVRATVYRPGCVAIDGERSHCRTKSNRQYIPIPNGERPPTALPIRVHVRDEAVPADATVTVHEVPADGAVPALLAETTRNDRAALDDLVVAPAPTSTLRITLDSTRGIDVPPEMWTRTWDQIVVQFLARETRARVKVLVGDRLERETMTVDAAEGAET